ncbi:restriction endonuclease [Phaeocystidibacter luteus]|uniref:Restriction endonuclease n=1 Tax=Phaeocystidibacter luteus TaxID=911197 RepID=A0A6N6RCK4_9FLAO|nr:restriction endonuclease [Phaeocystidibacter luteus]KAB2805313.1 restriction endonuclease [Phaeocystidibacter luteus]
MGAIVWSLENFVNAILDIVVIKTGLVISEDQLIEILLEEFPDDRNFNNYHVRKNRPVRIRSEEFDFYCWEVRKRLGELEHNIHPYFIGDVDKMMKWHEEGIDPIKVLKRLVDGLAEHHDEENPKLIDPEPILKAVLMEKIAPPEVIFELFNSLVKNQKLSNTIFPVEQVLWDGGTSLNDLFERESIPNSPDGFIDQKFINYLQANPNKLELMHWRNFERLTAEFFHRHGYKVDLGPGVNDGGVDVRVFDPKDDSKPLVIIQCKRHKESNQVKIETVKSFYSDVEFEGAKKGLIATTSRIAEGGKKVVSIRKYPLQFAENEEIKNWVNKMKKR